MFISIEGCDGSGKTTLCKHLYTLINQRTPCLLTREPGGTRLGESLRDILCDPLAGFDPLGETLLLLASRRLHLANVITPALASGKVVICDRFHESTIAYQAYGMGLEPRWIDFLGNELCEIPSPRRVFWIDLLPHVALERIKERANGNDRIEMKGIEFQTRVYEGYRELADSSPNLIFPLDGTQSSEELAQQAYEFLLFDS